MSSSFLPEFEVKTLSIAQNFNCRKTGAYTSGHVIWILSRRMTKPTKWPVRPAKTQISLAIHPVWPEPSLSTWKTYLLSAQWRLWSDWVDAQADLSLCWALVSFHWFCCVAAHLWNEPMDFTLKNYKLLRI